MQLDFVVIMEIVWLLSIGGIEYCRTNKIKKNDWKEAQNTLHKGIAYVVMENNW